MATYRCGNGHVFSSAAMPRECPHNCGSRNIVCVGGQEPMSERSSGGSRISNDPPRNIPSGRGFSPENSQGRFVCINGHIFSDDVGRTGCPTCGSRAVKPYSGLRRDPARKRSSGLPVFWIVTLPVAAMVLITLILAFALGGRSPHREVNRVTYGAGSVPVSTPRATPTPSSITAEDALKETYKILDYQNPVDDLRLLGDVLDEFNKIASVIASGREAVDDMRRLTSGSTWNTACRYVTMLNVVNHCVDWLDENVSSAESFGSLTNSFKSSCDIFAHSLSEAQFHTNRGNLIALGSSASRLKSDLEQVNQWGQKLEGKYQSVSDKLGVAIRELRSVTTFGAVTIANGIANGLAPIKEDTDNNLRSLKQARNKLINEINKFKRVSEYLSRVSITSGN